MSVHLASKIGKRPTNEDKYTKIINISGEDKSIHPINLFAVYDGHGGRYISTYLSNKIPNYFLDKKVEYPLSARYIHNFYKEIDKELATKYSKYSKECGSTCLIAVEYKYNANRYVDIINTGDSRCVICTGNIGIAKTKDHKPNWPEEAVRIKQLGGIIEFDNYDWRIKDLSVSRAFGDLDAKPYVTSKPDIIRHRVTKDDKFMILACDGLWDVFDNQEAVNAVLSHCYDIKSGKLKMNKKNNVALHLYEMAMKKGSTDNITILVVFF